MTRMDNTTFKYNVMQTVALSTEDRLEPVQVVARYYEQGIPSYKVRIINSLNEVMIVWEHELILIARTDTH